MVSTLSRQEKFNQVKRNYCFYLDIQEHELCRSISRRLQDMGLQQESLLSSRVTHVVRDAGGAPAGPRWRREPARARADAMLERVRKAPTQPNYVLLSVEKAIALLDKLYDTFFTAPRKPNVRLFTKHFIKIEFLDKLCRPLYKEFDEWPTLSVEPNPGKQRKEKKESTLKQGVAVNNNYDNIIGQNNEMTRKNRPRIKEKEDSEGGWWSACGAAYSSRAAHARSPRHAALARPAADHLALGAPPQPPVNGERRSPRNACNGGKDSPAPNGVAPRRRRADDRAYYRVVGVSTKLRSSGGFAPRRREAEPPGEAEPLVVKFRKVRRSELSVLSDEAEQFMFPKRASSASSSSSEAGSPAPPAAERRRRARPTALKEDSSEEDGWPAAAPARRVRRAAPAPRRAPPQPEPEPPPAPEPEPEPEPDGGPLRDEPLERCMRWEDGRLKYTPAVERLEFAFESVPRSEPWFETFERQDRDRVAVRDVPRCFALYSKSPKLPYEIGQLPPLKPDCCPLSALPKPARGEARAEPYGTRALKPRAAAGPALGPRPRKSPREHASTLAMLGSAGLLRRRADDAKSTASEDTVGDKPEPRPPPCAAREAEERLRCFLEDVFEDAAEYELDDVDGGAIPSAAAPPDVPGLVSECDACDIIRREVAEAAAARARRRGRVKKKNRTGWPNKKKPKKGSRTTSSEDRKTESSVDRSSVESPDAAGETCDESDSEKDKIAEIKLKAEDESRDEPAEVDSDDKCSDDKPLRLDVKVLLENKKDKAKAETKGSSRSSVSESEEKEEKVRKKKRALSNLASWLQPVVRVARVDPAAARRLRSAGAAKTRANRLR